MQTRIVFNGQEYSGPEQMPEAVWKAYQEMLAQLGADTDRNDVPDVLEGRGNVLGIQQSSITVNGRTFENVGDLPRPVRWLFEYARRQAAADRQVSKAPPGNEPLLKTLDSATSILGTLLQVVSAFLAGGLIIFGIWMIVHMDASSRSQGGAVYVGIGVLVAVAWLVGTIVSVARGRKR